MQNRTAILAFTILLISACLFQLSYTWVANSVEKDAKEYAQDKVDSLESVQGKLSDYSADTLYKNAEYEFLQSKQGEKVYPLLGFTYKKCKQNEINLGLDLQGGMNVMLEVSVVDLIKALASSNKDDEMLNRAIAMAIEKQKTSAEDFVTLFGKSFSEIDPNARLAAIFHTMENKEKFPREATNEAVLAIIQEEASDAIKRTEQVVRRRIDNLGVVQPKVQRLDNGRILIELPGVKDKDRVRKILQGTAKLEFWETYENSEIYPVLAQVNDLLKSETAVVVTAKNDTLSDSLSASGAAPDTMASDTSKKASLQEMLAETDTAKKDTSAAKTYDDFKKENPLFGILNPALVQDKSGQYYPGKGSIIGYAFVKDTAAVRNVLLRNDIKSMFPGKVKFLWDAKPFGEKEDVIQLYAIKMTQRDERAPLEGDVVTNAYLDTDPLGNPGVGVSMNSDGAKIWKLITKENVGKSIAIVLDNFVYSAPTVQGEIAGGRTSITGKFTVEEANDLANVLKAGKLPAPSRIVEEAVVGPTLGEKNINSGFMSFVIALVVVLGYMWFYYAKGGGVANIALISNMFFIIGVLASLGATLTLPGIAGIVLTIGMSVDANVLIFERIREEMREGKGLRLAIEDGYKNALSSILDSNITTLLTAIILLTFGSGPIQGFATTLIIGICTSLFSAIFITRLVFEYMMDKNKSITFSNKFTEGIFKNANYNWVGKRKLFYMISGIVITAGIASVLIRGLNFGVDFTGGRSYLVSFEQAADINKIGDALENVFVEENGLKARPVVKTYGATNQVNIITKYMIDYEGEDAEERVEQKLNEGLNVIGEKYSIEWSRKVGPTVAEDLKKDALLAIIFSLAIIFLYILFRFKKWQFGAGATMALFHDVMIVISVYSLFYGILPFSLEVDLDFIAAILTVVGYSINDTVVVFDRIREYLGRYKRQERNLIINNALNSTLGRTVNTSLTTIFVLVMMFIFGGEVIRGFCFALIVGIAVGTYSSLGIAAPVVIDFSKKEAEPAKA